MIKTAASLGGVESLARVYASRSGVQLLPVTETAQHSVKARVDHSRWIVDCPGCSGAEMVDPKQPVFMCLSCLNAFTGGKWLKVSFPKNRQAIEGVLLARSKEANRNWSPTESVQDLQGENDLASKLGVL